MSDLIDQYCFVKSPAGDKWNVSDEEMAEFEQELARTGYDASSPIN